VGQDTACSRTDGDEWQRCLHESSTLAIAVTVFQLRVVTGTPKS
jgi:hypothetical protein